MIKFRVVIILRDVIDQLTIEEREYHLFLLNIFTYLITSAPCHSLPSYSPTT